MGRNATSDWNSRFSAPGYLYGTEPADFIRTHGDLVRPGDSVLAVADGEGRNSVYLAERGARVTAFDSSDVALDKARALARNRGVTVDFRHGDAATWDWTAEAFDVVAAIFIQFAAPPLRRTILAGLDAALRPGGLLLLHGFAPRQVEYGTGGPPHAENMYDLPMLRAAFEGYTILHQDDYDADISSGTGHSGRAALIDFVARKPA